MRLAKREQQQAPCDRAPARGARRHRPGEPRTSRQSPAAPGRCGQLRSRGTATSRSRKQGGGPGSPHRHRPRPPGRSPRSPRGRPPAVAAAPPAPPPVRPRTARTWDGPDDLPQERARLRAEGQPHRELIGFRAQPDRHVSAWRQGVESSELRARRG